MTEVWKSISGFSNYEVSTKGRIRSIKRVKKFKNGRLVQFESKIKLIRKHPKNGFLMTDLISNDGKRKTVYPHKVVAQAFIENEDPVQNKVVVHKDDDLSNNHAENLKWSSYSQSIRNGFKTGKRDNSTLWFKRRLKYGPQGGNKSTTVAALCTLSDVPPARRSLETDNISSRAEARQQRSSARRAASRGG